MSRFIRLRSRALAARRFLLSVTDLIPKLEPDDDDDDEDDDELALPELVVLLDWREEYDELLVVEQVDFAISAKGARACCVCACACEFVCVSVSVCDLCKG